MCHCQPAPATTYHHVIDEHTGEHIATYTDRYDAYRRAAENGSDTCAVTTGPVPRVTIIDGRDYYDGELINTEDVTR